MRCATVQYRYNLVSSNHNELRSWPGALGAVKQRAAQWVLNKLANYKGLGMTEKEKKQEETQTGL